MANESTYDPTTGRYTQRSTDPPLRQAIQWGFGIGPVSNVPVIAPTRGLSIPADGAEALVDTMFWQVYLGANGTLQMPGMSGLIVVPFFMQITVDAYETDGTGQIILHHEHTFEVGEDPASAFTTWTVQQTLGADLSLADDGNHVKSTAGGIVNVLATAFGYAITP